MIEIILLTIIVIGIIILVFQNFKKNKPTLNNQDEIGKLTTINSGIDDLKTRHLPGFFMCLKSLSVFRYTQHTLIIDSPR